MKEFKNDVEAIDSLAADFKKLQSEIGKVIIGQDEVVQNVLMSIFADGHSLLVGVPGLAKTLLIKTISDALHLSFKRIQFTPDLMPSDITGSEILDDNRNFKFLKGPVFANIILADEINHAPPKTQAALLEAMQEKMLPLADIYINLNCHFLYWQRKTRLSRKEPILYRKPSSTVLCSTSF